MAQIKSKAAKPTKQSKSKTLKYSPTLEAAIKNKEVIKIDLGCGAKKQPGFIGIDNRKLPGVDVVQDVTQFPWSLPSDCASLVMASHLVEHINPMTPDVRATRLIELLLEKKLITKSEVDEKIGETSLEPTFIRFMDEVWRILKPGGQFMAAMPYAGSAGFYQDPTHINNVTEATWAYFDPLAPGRLYYLYMPKPRKIISLQYSQNGNLEVVLEKRMMDPSYMQGAEIYG
jgi:hypothetical protein